MQSNSPPPLRYGRRRELFAAVALALTALALALLTSSGGERPVTAPSAVATIAASSGTSVGAVDEPNGELVVGTKVHIVGWALHPAGIDRVEIRLDRRSYAARYGLVRNDVAKVKPGYPDSSAAGFVFDADFGNLAPLRHMLEIVAVNRAGGENVLARKSLVSPQAMRLWSELLDAQPDLADRSFRFLMATSGVAFGGAAEVESVYDGYRSRTQQIGIAVPILYLRTTEGAARDWVFDPDFGSRPKCGDRPVADDSLNDVIRYAIQKKLPVQFILNGGIWSNASCGTPEWDLNDYLEQDDNNCQWTQHNVVFPADYVKNLPGSTQSPRLARSLSYNVYATTVRSYKKRNLQAAARIVAAFAREHPDLFVGVNLDADTYMNPFVRQGNWYDYNPGMLKQFRHWLAGSGPYAGKPDAGAPNLVAYRRKDPLTLADVNRLARKKWTSWDKVDPPRRFRGPGGEPLAAGDVPYFRDPWYLEWDAFRKHVVALHYSELSQWVFEAGIPKDRIFSAQAFIAPDPGLAPISLHIRGSSPNYDSAGVSIEGSIPAYGHAGAILYGPAAANEHPMEDGHSLFSTLGRMDPGWAVVETNATDLKTMARPTYAQSYHAFRDLFNFDARQVSLMAWNGSNGDFADQPGYVPYTSWRNTPAEAAMRDFLVTHADLPRGARLWTFGAIGYADDDGWRLEKGTLNARGGQVDLALLDSTATLLSPPDQVIRPESTELLVLGFADQVPLVTVAVYARRSARSPWRALGAPIPATRLKRGAAGWQVPLAWPQDWQRNVRFVEELKIVLAFAPGTGALRLDRIALFPKAQ